MSLLASDHLAAKALRFALVGVGSGTIYAAVTALLVSFARVSPVPASLVGYLVSALPSFLGHRSFSFRSNGHWTGEAMRFAVAQAVNIAVTMLAMHAATAWLGKGYGWGMAGAVIFVPIANFIVMNLWVFREQSRTLS
jgi:putative flippase GtrA